MGHMLKVRVGKDIKEDSLVSYKKLTIRERILKLLFGNRKNVTLVVPGLEVKEIEVEKMKD